MDQKTISEYDLHSRQHIQRWDTQTPVDLYKQISYLFRQNGKTLDLGCGSGRDLLWLLAQGYDAIGIDASQGLIAEVKKSHPPLKVTFDSLPLLSNLADETYENVLCSGVLMHVPDSQIVEACINILRVLKKGGVLILSFRNSLTDSERESDGRLYTNLVPQQLASLFESLGANVLEIASNQSNDKRAQWHTLGVRKQTASDYKGLPKIQEIITRDRKTTTYKLALIRAFAKIAAIEPKTVRWQGDLAAIPMKRVAMWWLRFYWPFIVGGSKGRQINDKRPLRFERSLMSIKGEALSLVDVIITYEKGLEGVRRRRNLLSEESLQKKIEQTLKKISSTIVDGPLAYICDDDRNTTTMKSEMFFATKNYFDDLYILVPAVTWREITKYFHWIEQAVILEWAQLIDDFSGKQGKVGQWVSDLLDSNALDERDTNDVRQLVTKQTSILCTWTGNPIKQFDVDHVIPWSLLHNNDLWNLLPATKTINNTKSAKLPLATTIMANKETIFYWWDLYLQKWPERFSVQVKRALGADPKQDKSYWQPLALSGLVELVERVASTRGCQRWGG